MDTNTLIILGGALALLYAWKTFGPNKAAPRKVVKEKIAGGATILDVRTGGEFASGAYPHARNIPLDALGSQLGKLGKKDGSIVVYCASGARSAQAARLLKSAGFSDVTNAGGLGSMPR